MVRSPARSVPPRRNQRALVGSFKWGLCALAVLGYALVAASSYLGQSPAGVAFLSLLFATGLFFVLRGPPGSRFDSFQILTVPYLFAFAVAPIPEPDSTVVYYAPYPWLVTVAAAYAFGAYLALAAGYYSPEWIEMPVPRPKRATIGESDLQRLGIVLFSIGAFAYLLLLALIGGPASLFGEESLLERFVGLGFVGRTTSLMICGSVVYCARWAHDPRAKAWRALSLVALCVVALLPFQARSRALHPAIAAALVFYLSRSKMRWGRLAAVAVAAYLVVMFIGFSRQLWIRPLLLTQPGTVLVEFVIDFKNQAAAQLSGSLARLWMVMFVFDRIPTEIPYGWGSSFLLFLNPLTRRFGWGEVIPLDFTLGEASMPVNPVNLAVGLNPSFIGEMRANFPWPLALLCLALCGYLLRRLHEGLLGKRRDADGVAIYALAISSINAAIVTSIGGDLIYALCVATPPWIAIRWMKRRGAAQRVAAERLRAPVAARRFGAA